MRQPLSLLRFASQRKLLEVYYAYQRRIARLSGATTVSLIGSKWKLLIMRNLLMRPWRFNELRKSLDGISQKVLTDSLCSMEEDGLVVRTVYAEVPPRVEYALSPLGESMQPIIKSMETWGLAYKSGALPRTAEE